MSVVIPTLQAGPLLADCLNALEAQTFRDFEVVVVDNSGQGLVRRLPDLTGRVRIIENTANVGYGAAINQAVASSRAEFVAALNDDTTPCAQWLDVLVSALRRDRELGACASCVLLAGEGVLDSAGMLLGGDGSSKQRGHGESPAAYEKAEPVLFSSGSAALYRRKMLDHVGGFDESYFLYCEDTDLGLRAAWAGWKCGYAPGAKVQHHYSKSAGRVSPLKAYLVERNRLFVLVKTFPASLFWKAPFITLARYAWHAVAMLSGKGAAGGFRREGNSGALALWIVIRAHLALIGNLGRLWRQRRQIRRQARISAAEFVALARQHAISARQVASL